MVTDRASGDEGDVVPGRARSVAEGLEPTGGDDLATTLPESLTIEVALPAPVHEAP